MNPSERLRRLIAGAVLVFATGCKPPAPGHAPSATRAADAPPTSTEVPTTDGGIALGNLEAQIESTGARVAARPDQPGPVADLVQLLLIRAQYLARLADYERAMEWAEGLVQKSPNEAEARLLRAETRSALHDFDGALADLDRVDEPSPSPVRSRSIRISVLTALESYEEALTLQEVVVGETPTLDSLGTLAVLLGRLGRDNEAREAFKKAYRVYRNVSPFPVAWLDFQQALFWEERGNSPLARTFLESAHSRLPAYAEAASHLAALWTADGSVDRAIEIIEPVHRLSDHPQYAADLSVLYERAGRVEEAARLRMSAATDFERWVARLPRVVTPSAIRFWLARGNDPGRALALSGQHFGTLPTSETFELLIDAAIANGRPEAPCSAIHNSLETKIRSPRLNELARRTRLGCSDRESPPGE